MKTVLSLSAVLLLACASLADTVDSLAGKRTFFLGDSITQAGGYITFASYYLDKLYPEKNFDIIGLGLASETVSGLSEKGHAGGAFPRPCLFARLGRLLDRAKPEIVFACYGMNDGIYQALDPDRFAAFRKGIQKLIDQCKAAGVKEIFLITPPIYDFSPQQGEFNYDTVLTAYAAWEMTLKIPGVHVIDLHTAMRKARDARTEIFSKDHVHPGDDGHLLMAKTVLAALGAKVPDDSLAAIHGDPLFKLVAQQRELRSSGWMQHVGYTREKTVLPQPLGNTEAEAKRLQKKIDALRRHSPAQADAASDAKLSWPGEKLDTWHGSTRHTFQVDGCTAWVVEPHRAAAGNPWTWCMEFPDAFTDRTGVPKLLENGWFNVHIEVGNTFGCPAAQKHFDAFYRAITAKGLATKGTLIGISRGGLYCYNWAARNPDKVLCIYGDAPVCDIKSWPGGKGAGMGSRGDWQALIELYGFKNEAEALVWKGNPIDNLAPLAKARIPLIHVVGDSDDGVPVKENTAIIEQRYKALGGEIKVIHKPGVGHHPHGLDDPQPLVDFIVHAKTAADCRDVPKEKSAGTRDQ